MTRRRNQSVSSARPANDPLDRLRGHRTRPDRARSLGDDLSIQMKTMKTISHAESAASDAWETAVPDQISAFSSIGGLKAGKLVVFVPSAAHRHVVDRWLGSGGMAQFQSLARVPIRGVELKIAPQSDPNGP